MVTASACLNTDCTRLTSKAHEGLFSGSLSLQERSRDPPWLAAPSTFFALCTVAVEYMQHLYCMGALASMACLCATLIAALPHRSSVSTKHQQQAGNKGGNSPPALCYFEHVINMDYADCVKDNKQNCHQQFDPPKLRCGLMRLATSHAVHAVHCEPEVCAHFGGCASLTRMVES